MRINRRHVVLAFGFWLVVALLHVVGLWLTSLVADGSFGLLGALRTIVVWSTWAPASLVVVMLVRVLPVRRSNWWYAVPVHAIGATAVSLALCVLVSLMTRIIPVLFQPPPIAYGVQVRNMFARSIADDGMIYLSLLVAVLAFEATHQRAELRVRTKELDRQLSEARLHALTMQIRPHFLANTLQTIAVLIDQGEQEEASELTDTLGMLFRRMLRSGNEPLVPLEDEISLLDGYLHIEQTRFRDRLDIRLEIDNSCRAALVPPLLLQPIVENAIRYGVEPAETAGRVTVSAFRENDLLRLSVSDDGSGFAPHPETEGGGVGLANTRARLEALYGTDGFNFTIDPGEHGGTTVVIELPFREHG